MVTQSDVDLSYCLARRLREIPGLELKENEPLSRHTSFGIGGPADLLVIPSEPAALCHAVTAIHEVGVAPLILGNGTNLIVRNGGIRGVVIRVGGEMGAVEFEDTRVLVEAGASLAAACLQCAHRGLSGLEFAAGIPGTIGGALIMNAGAYGGEIGDITEWVEVATPEGTIERVGSSELSFGYRRSALRRLGHVVVRACLQLSEGNPSEIHAKLCDTMETRCAKQPVSSPSAGSIFKRPEGDYAGRLLEAAGAKGMRVGRAAVSTKHANFVVNLGGATAADVIGLIEATRALVYEKFGVMLEPEVCVAGEEC
ncbi:MAG: UDP-N-acetylmuramate dehydrogenase [Armatimonadota bacterium]|jgi:UDP-N-acetylmuramate dehydrogenase